jgi:hypothetical protein
MSYHKRDLLFHAKVINEMHVGSRLAWTLVGL